MPLFSAGHPLPLKSLGPFPEFGPNYSSPYFTRTGTYSFPNHYHLQNDRFYSAFFRASYRSTDYSPESLYSSRIA